MALLVQAAGATVGRPQDPHVSSDPSRDREPCEEQRRAPVVYQKKIKTGKRHVGQLSLLIHLSRGIRPIFQVVSNHFPPRSVDG